MIQIKKKVSKIKMKVMNKVIIALINAIFLKEYYEIKDSE